MIESDLLAALRPLVAALDEIGVAYFIGGSVASSAYGRPRTTLDVDLVVDLKPSHVHPLVHHLDEAYYVSTEMIEDAIRRQSSFNVVHLATMLKLDLFVLKVTAYDQGAFRRAQVQKMAFEAGGASFSVALAEDIVLHKLLWYRMGDEVSERQWGDLMGVLKVQGDALDGAYLRQWAATLNISDLLDRALDEAGLTLPDA